jgi:PadR family transcriptional regulator PadR
MRRSQPLIRFQRANVGSPALTLVAFNHLRAWEARSRAGIEPPPPESTHLDLRHIVGVYVEVQGMVTMQKSDLPQGTLDLLILNVVALGPMHGYAIAQRLRQVSREVVNVTQGTLYPALHRLENRGFLAADWKLSDTGRDAKFYKLTTKGRAHMASEADSWRRLAQAVGAILKTSEGVS